MKIINNKVFKTLLVVFIISFILGIVLFFFISDTDKLKIESSLINYINSINNNSFMYGNGLVKSILFNYKYLFIIWLCGILYILVFFIPFIVSFKGVILGFSISSIISVYGLVGFLIALILLLYEVINITLILLISYYAVHFSYKCFKTIKNNKSINLRLFIKNYIYIFLIILSLSFLSSLIEIFICSNILKFVV